jgi:hypothetical protein
MKQFLFSISFMLLSLLVKAQCPTSNIGLTTQAQIDAFPSMYPGCTFMNYKISIMESIPGDITNLSGLSGLQQVNVGLEIGNNTALSNLNGLSGLTNINGTFLLAYNNSLSSIQGLNNITGIGGNVFIGNNNLLTSLNGLSNLSIIGGGLEVSDNSLLTNLNGLNSLTVINNDLTISNNNSLSNLDSLSTLETIGGNLIFYNNNSLKNLLGLNSLNLLCGGIIVENNPSLTSLAGLSNIDHNNINFLALRNSNELSSCSVPSICNYLSSGKPSDIIGNRTPCNTSLEIINNCGQICPDASYSFNTQNQINIFPTLYPNCKVFPNDLSIQFSTNLFNLDSLVLLKKIDGNLSISDNISLINIDGLRNVDTIMGSLTVSRNFALENLGMNSLRKVDGYLDVFDNPVLSNLYGLNSLNRIEGNLYVEKNPILASLFGLDNIDASSITNLYIRDNTNLSICGVPSICSYLSNIMNPYTISDNTVGCGSIADLNTACVMPCPSAYPTATWLGKTNSNWSTPSNWPCGIIPPINARVIVPANSTNIPIVDINVELEKLTLSPGTILNVLPGVTFKIKGN